MEKTWLLKQGEGTKHDHFFLLRSFDFIQPAAPRLNAQPLISGMCLGRVKVFPVIHRLLVFVDNTPYLVLLSAQCHRFVSRSTAVLMIL